MGHKEYKFSRSAAPFNTIHGRDGKDKVPTPGPGAYEHAQAFEGGQKVVLSSGNSDVRILEVPKP